MEHRPWLHSIDPVALDLGFFAIHWYGLTYLAAFAAFMLLGRLRMRDPRYNMNFEALSDLLFFGVIGVILGGRLGYVLFYAFSDLLRDPLMLFRVWEGGMSFHGGMLGVVGAVLWFCRKTERSVIQVLDFITPLGVMGLGFGRLGNFIGGELWGRHTDVSWGVVFPASLDPSLSMTQIESMHATGLLDHEARHPSQLYQAGLEGILLFGLVWWFSSRPRPAMAVTGLFLLLYGVFRFAVEFVREPDAHLGFVMLDWMTMGQILSLPLMLAGALMMVLAYRRTAAQTG